MTLRSLAAYASMLLIVAGCAKPAPPPPVPAAVVTNDTEERSFEEAADVASDALVAQLQRAPAASAKTDAKRGVVIDPMIDSSSGQQTATTQALEQRVAQRLASGTVPLEVMPFLIANIGKAQYLLTGTMTRTPSSQAGAPQVFLINLALTDLQSGTVVAQASSRARDEGLDTNPTRYYRDSPVLVKDNVVDGYIATSQAAPGTPADPVYFERVATASTIAPAQIQ